MLTARAITAIKVMQYLARSIDPTPIKLDQISRDTGIQRHAVVKAIQDLQKHRLIKSSRGSHGGVEIAKTPEAITMGEIVCAVDGPPIECQSSTNNGNCNPSLDCAIYRRWAQLEDLCHNLAIHRTLKNFAA